MDAILMTCLSFLAMLMREQTNVSLHLEERERESECM